MIRTSNFEILHENDEVVTLVDLGPWDQYKTITNAVESVVKQMIPVLKGRKLFYHDSEGDVTEIIIKDGRFSGFGF